VGTGFAAAKAALAIPSLWYAVRGSPVTAGDLVRAFGRPLLAATAAGLGLAALRSAGMLGSAEWIGLVSGMPLFGIGYLVAWLGIPGGRKALAEMLAAAREIRGSTA